MNLHDSPFKNGLLFVNFNQDFGEKASRALRESSLLLLFISEMISRKQIC